MEPLPLFILKIVSNGKNYIACHSHSLIHTCLRDDYVAYVSWVGAWIRIVACAPMNARQKKTRLLAQKIKVVHVIDGQFNWDIDTVILTANSDKV